MKHDLVGNYLDYYNHPLKVITTTFSVNVMINELLFFAIIKYNRNDLNMCANIFYTKPKRKQVMKCEVNANIKWVKVFSNDLNLRIASLMLCQMFCFFCVQKQKHKNKSIDLLIEMWSQKHSTEQNSTIRWKLNRVVWCWWLGKRRFGTIPHLPFHTW